MYVPALFEALICPLTPPALPLTRFPFRLADLRQHLEGVAHRFGRQGSPHQQADVQRLRQLRVRPAQVEDLLDTMVNSVEAVLRDGHR